MSTTCCFAIRRRGRVALNIGGIANITAIPPKATPKQVIAFDTGPGNMVIDALVGAVDPRQSRRMTGTAAWRREGAVNKALLDELLAEPYYRKRPPKSAGPRAVRPRVRRAAARDRAAARSI